VSTAEQVAVIATLIGAAIAVLTLALWIYERRRHPEPVEGQPIRGRRRISTRLFWHPGQFYQALGYFDGYCDRLRSQLTTPRPGTHPTELELLHFAQSLLLTAASEIAPFSQGKANLFHYCDAPGAERRQIVSYRFIGVFPPRQVLAGGTGYRPMNIDESAARDSHSIAAQSILNHGTIVRSISHSQYSSEIEKDLRTTHILATPTFDDDFHRVGCDRPAAITVDLHIVWFLRWTAREDWPVCRWICRRGRFLSTRLKRIEELQDLIHAQSATIEATPAASIDSQQTGDGSA
jgi:hypothetical protein